MKSEEQLRKAFKEINTKHTKVYKRHHSPIDLGYTEQYKYGEAKWLERSAGFIQGLRFSLDEDGKLPDQLKEFEV